MGEYEEIMNVTYRAIKGNQIANFGLVSLLMNIYKQRQIEEEGADEFNGKIEDIHMMIFANENFKKETTNDKAIRAVKFLHSRFDVVGKCMICLENLTS